MEANKFGGEYQVRMENLNNIELFNSKWQELVASVISGEFPHSDKVNGIRVVDKSKSGSEQFRYEIWFSFGSEDCDEARAIKQYLEANFVEKIPGGNIQWASHKF